LWSYSYLITATFLDFNSTFSAIFDFNFNLFDWNDGMNGNYLISRIYDICVFLLDLVHSTDSNKSSLNFSPWASTCHILFQRLQSNHWTDNSYFDFLRQDKAMDELEMKNPNLELRLFDGQLIIWFASTLLLKTMRFLIWYYQQQHKCNFDSLIDFHSVYYLNFSNLCFLSI